MNETQLPTIPRVAQDGQYAIRKDADFAVLVTDKNGEGIYSQHGTLKAAQGGLRKVTTGRLKGYFTNCHIVAIER